jgi:predicted ATPase
LTTFVGREREVLEVAARLRRSDVRLVTLTGPGGVGKTRLSLKVAEELAVEFADGVAFIDLTSVTEPDKVAPTVAQAFDMREAGDRSVADRLVDALRDRRLLLVFDIFEPVVAAAPLVVRLLSSCPRLKVLVTSREPLHLAAEWVVGVGPLMLPDSDRSVDDLLESEAVRLFVERAQAVRSDFALTDATARSVTGIVHRVEGLPLAIELAAARLAHLPPAALLQRLEHRLPLLTGGARDLPDRQRTLRGTIAWSYDLLPPEEQWVFRRLAVFVGGCTLEAAECIANTHEDLGGDALDVLGSLVSKSLLRQEEDHDAGPRFTMLETVREYGLEQPSSSSSRQSCSPLRTHSQSRQFATLLSTRPAIHRPKHPIKVTQLVEVA